MTQDELAARADVSQGAVSRLENGRGVATPLRSVMGVLGALAESLRTLPPKSVPDDVLWLIGVPQLAPWASSGDPVATAGDPVLKALIEPYRTMAPEYRVAFGRAALALAEAFTTPTDGE